MPTIDLARLEPSAATPSRTAPPEAMPGKSRSKKGAEEAEAWQTESHARISARAKERAANRAQPSLYGFEKLATRPIDKLALGEPIAPGEQETRRTAEQTTQYAFRTSQEGQMAAGFSPHRHSVTVCGRPVQVTVARKSLDCAFFASISVFFVCVFAVGLLPASVSSSP